jgi:hypothetical protein
MWRVVFVGVGIIMVTGLSCAPYSSPPKYFPITSGGQIALPARGASVRVIAQASEVQRTMVTWLAQYGYRILSDDGVAAVILGQVVEQPAMTAGVTPEVIIRLQRPPERASVIVGRAMMPIAMPQDDNVLHALTCQALATAWGYRPSGQLEIPSEPMCAVGKATDAVKS